jgi:putative transposase
MKEWQAQAHVTWDCKFHVVILPKYRRKEFFASVVLDFSVIGDFCRDLGLARLAISGKK